MTSKVSTQSASRTSLPEARRGCLWMTLRVARWLCIVLIIFALLGVVYQTAAEASDWNAYAPPGRLLDVDGHQMHIVCTGEGSPTVILEAGAGAFSAIWGWVQLAVAQQSRVCAYDRAGFGWSEFGPEPRDAQQIARELHALLADAGVAPPYVMVGHSLGGIYVRVYNAMYPGEVVGMALIDSTHPDNWSRQGESLETLGAMASVSAVLSRFGVMRLAFAGEHFNLPEPDSSALLAYTVSTRYWDMQRADMTAATATIDEGRAAGTLGDLPLAVLTAVDYPEGKGRDTELALQMELAALSSNSIYQVVDGARHITLLTDEQYAKQVSDAVIRVVEAARTGESLAQ